MVIYVRDDGSTLRPPSVLVEANTHDAYVLLVTRCTQECLGNREGQAVLP